LKKTLLYILAAVILGLSLTFVPLITTAEVKTNSNYLLMPEYHSSQLQESGGVYRLVSAKYAPADLEIFVISFVMALVAYLWVRQKMPHNEIWFRFPPF
jgi:hypothetical protein